MIVPIRGQTRGTLWRAASLLTLLKALAASTSRMPSTSSCFHKACIACVAASIPDGRPTHVWRGPHASCISVPATWRIVLEMIRLTTSHTPTGRTSGVFFLRATRRQATRGLSLSLSNGMVARSCARVASLEQMVLDAPLYAVQIRRQA